MAMTISGTAGATFPDATTQATALPAASTGGNVLTSNGTNWVSTTPSSPNVRQTVFSGPVDSNGLPNFGGSTGSTTVTASGTLLVSAAYAGSTLFGSTTNPSWTGLSTNGTMYLGLEVATTGTCTTFSTTLAPVYQFGGTPSTTSGQHTFNTQQMTMYLGNGSTAPQVWRVFVGQVTVSGGVVSAITWYALNGRYYAPFTATLPTTNTYTSFNHNIGTNELYAEPVILLECTTIDQGYSVGERLTKVGSQNAGGPTAPIPVSWTALSAGFVTANTNPWVTEARTGGQVVLTRTSWKYSLIVSRGW